MKITIEREFNSAAEALAFLRKFEAQTGGVVQAEVVGDAPETQKPKRRARNGKPNTETTTAAVVPVTLTGSEAPMIEQVQAELEKVFAARGLQTARDLLVRYGVEKTKNLKPEHYAKFIEEAKRVAAGEDPAAAR